MFRESLAISGFSTNDIVKTKEFYAGTLGLEVTEANGMLTLHLAGGGTVLVYPKENHKPATYTALNFQVQDIDGAVDGLTAAGIVLERYDSAGQDDRGIAREYGPAIAWFKDPAGNILAVVQQ